MRYIIVVVFMFFHITKSSSQTYEIGPLIGGFNYIGDVGNTTYINPSNLGIGGVFKWNRSNRHSFRFSILYTKIEANDANSDEGRRKERGFEFENPIFETSLGMEYTFVEYDLHSGKPQSTPYLYTGLNLFSAKHFFLENQQLTQSKANWEIAIPMAVGFKTTITRKLIGAIEIGARYTFTDNLDGSNPSEMDGHSYASFGNKNTNDWYVFTGVTLTFAFGRKPCFCIF